MFPTFGLSNLRIKFSLNFCDKILILELLFSYYHFALSAGFRKTLTGSSAKGYDPLPPPKKGIVLNCIQWWGSISGHLGSMEYFIANTIRSSLTQGGSIG